MVQFRRITHEKCEPYLLWFKTYGQGKSFIGKKVKLQGLHIGH